VQPLDLIKTSKALLSPGVGRPTAASLRRATSGAYYALFHCLARNCATLLVGSLASGCSKKAWLQAYRSLEHSHAKTQCKNKEVISKFPKNIEDFASIFVTLQQKRHDADYDHFAIFLKLSVSADVILAEQAIKSFNMENISDRRAFCVWVLLKDRKS